MTKKHPYYNFAKILSFNAVFNFIVGGRGIGKTFGAKIKAVKAALYRGEQFIYLRRYKTELAPARGTFFVDIADKFPNWDFRIQGNEAQAAPVKTRNDKKREWRTLGYFIALSTAQTQKSVSYTHVKRIIFDEFILEDGSLSYIPNEADVFNNFYSTVDRWQDKTTVFFLANSVSIMNPYFLKYKIRPDQESEFVIRNGGYVACHFVESEAFASSVFKTRFGQFIAGTEYAEYAVGNQFDDNHDAMVALKTSQAKYMFTLETKLGTFSVWHTLVNDEYFVQAKRPKNEIILTLVAAKMGPDKTLVTLNDRPLQYLRTAFRHARMLFDEPTTRNAFAEIFTR